MGKTISFTSSKNGKKAEKQDQQSKQHPAHLSFLTEQELYEVLAVPQEQYNLEGTILGGCPHHLVAGNLIIDLLAALVPKTGSNYFGRNRITIILVAE